MPVCFSTNISQYLVVDGKEMMIGGNDQRNCCYRYFGQIESIVDFGEIQTMPRRKYY